MDRDRMDGEGPDSRNPRVPRETNAPDAGFRGEQAEVRGKGGPTVIAGRYELRRLLGKGGMGVVWEAWDGELKRSVALKGLRFTGADSRALARARREAQAIAHIKNPNVVSVHDVISTDSEVWIVMELHEAPSLADLLSQDQLSVRRAARIGLQVVEGLRAVHQAGVLHRDIKPSNLLVLPNDRVLLVDFGIATFEGAEQVTLSAEIAPGTPKYLAPELLYGSSGESRKATEESDLWSLGVTLFEMVEGRPPFDGESPWEVYRALAEDPVPPMVYAGPLAPLITELLAKEPDERPSVRHVEEALRQVAAGEPRTATHSPRPSAATHPPRPPRPSAAGQPPESQGPRPAPKARQPWRVAVAVTASLAVLAGGGWLVWQVVDEDGAEKPPPSRAQPEPKPEPVADASFQRLEEARKGERRWVVGLKDGQPGLSDLKGREWSGVEYEYARRIVDSLGIPADNVTYQDVGTSDRAPLLHTGEVDMMIGTYGISDQREKGADGDPPVTFAGPYFKTTQSVMLEKHPTRKDPNTARIRGEARVVQSFANLPSNTRLCLVGKSTAYYYLKGPDAPRFPYREIRDDYDYCVRGLRDDFDAVITDTPILEGFLKDQEDKYLIARGGLPDLEEYGIGLKAGSDGLRQEVCAAIEANRDFVVQKYEKLTPRAEWLTPELTRCEEPS